jgi:hypothetical protein
MSLTLTQGADAVQGFFLILSWENIVTSGERHEARYQRRKAGREAKRREKLSKYDDFGRIIDADNLYKSFKKSLKNGPF